MVLLCRKIKLRKGDTMKKIYFAAPLFNEMELKRNEEYT